MENDFFHSLLTLIKLAVKFSFNFPLFMDFVLFCATADAAAAGGAVSR
jgi:hypothetical protein